MATNLDQIKDSKLVLKDGTITASDVAKHNQRCTSEDDSIENDPKKLYVIRRIRQNINLTNALCCKILVFFSVCFIVLCFLMPVILYSVNQARDDDETKTAEYSHEKNTSRANVCCRIYIYIYIYIYTVYIL